MRNHNYENDFDLHENETACRTHFHVKGFALRLVLKQRHKRTRKWPISSDSLYGDLLLVLTEKQQLSFTGRLGSVQLDVPAHHSDTVSCLVSKSLKV